MPAITFVLDISHHQDKRLDLARARRDGCEACLIKATEGGSFVDPDFASNVDEARNAGMLVAAYAYQRANASAAAHVDLIRRVVPRNVPIILDVEKGSGGLALTRDIIARLRSAGYTVPLLYLPRWYWQQLGRPSLAGLPPLWSSRYPDMVVGTLADEWADVPAHYWDGYGGNTVALLQFTSSARIAGYQPLDASAYRGTHDELTRFLGSTQIQEDDDMAGPNDHEYPPSNERQYHHRTIETRSIAAVVGDVWFAISAGYHPMTNVTVYLNRVHEPIVLDEIPADTRMVWQVPDGCESISWEYDCAGPSSSAVIYSKR